MPPETGRGPLLAVREMSLHYGARQALDAVSFEVPRGSLFGLLGPNGSGKTSLFAGLTGQHPAQAAHVELAGETLALGHPKLRRELGIVFQQPSLDVHLSGRENLLLSARLYGMRGTAAKQRLEEVLGWVQMQDRAGERVRQLSGGLRRRLELGRALMHRPSLLLLDEPTTGLDPLAVERTWDRLQQLRQETGMSLICSTHRADEAARCDRLLVLDQGKVVQCATPDALLAQVSEDVILLQARGGAAAAELLRQRFDLAVQSAPGADSSLTELRLRLPAGHTWVPRLIEAFEPGQIASVIVRRPTLADVFLQLTGKDLDPAGQQEAA
jgi:ABC-2 type transport system ATP-binding protein